MNTSTKLSVSAATTREKILDAAIVVLADRGYSAAGVQEIINKSQTSKGSFYFHFPSKEKMVSALVDQLSLKLVSKVQKAMQQQPTPIDRLTIGIEVLLNSFSRQRKIAQILVLNVMGHGQSLDRKFLPLWQRFADLIQTELDTAVQENQIPPLDSSLAAQIWLGALHQVIVKWLVVGEPNRLTEATPALQEILLRGIGANITKFPKYV